MRASRMPACERMLRSVPSSSGSSLRPRSSLLRRRWASARRPPCPTGRTRSRSRRLPLRRRRDRDRVGPRRRFMFGRVVRRRGRLRNERRRDRDHGCEYEVAHGDSLAVVRSLLQTTSRSRLRPLTHLKCKHGEAVYSCSKAIVHRNLFRISLIRFERAAPTERRNRGFARD